MQKPRMERYLHEVERAVGTYSSSEAPARQRERRLVQRIRENDMAHGEDLLPHSLRVGVLYLLMVDIVICPRDLLTYISIVTPVAEDYFATGQALPYTYF